MKRYACDAGLTEPFKMNGFIDLTQGRHPGHAGKPDGKRAFKLPRRSRRSIITIDYCTLKSNELPHIEVTISEEELKAYICFHKLPTRSRNIMLTLSPRQDRLELMMSLIRQPENGDSNMIRVKPGLLDEVQKTYAEIKL
ncbi:hypothetical protein [Pontibacter pamirensis]|uniref:hypothetical protein n=1 Tax=Pontibacter pamirensis TaxID=2562824 RepID=UPI001389EBB3|nr:hypothetical protein [Pontibacter pamirensis]